MREKGGKLKSAQEIERLCCHKDIYIFLSEQRADHYHHSRPIILRQSPFPYICVYYPCITCAPFRCVAWSPDGQLLIVGLGGSPVPGRGKQSKDGVFVVLNALTMEVGLHACVHCGQGKVFV